MNMRNLYKAFRRALPGLLCLGLAFYLAPKVVPLSRYQDKQAIAYDMAFESLSKGGDDAGPQALALLNQSFNVYKDAATYDWRARFNFPQPDQEMAALVFFHEGNLLRQMNKGKEALAAYVVSLRLNPGQGLLPGVSGRDDPMHQYGRDFCVAPADKLGMSQPAKGEACQVLRLEKEADDTRNNLLSLINAKPELKPLLANPQNIKAGDGQGKGAKGEPGKMSDLPGAVSGPHHDHGDDRKI